MSRKQQPRHEVLAGYLNEEDTGKALHRTPRTLAIWRQRGEGPAYIRVGRTVYYAIDAITAWLKGTEIKPVRARAA